MMGFWIWLIGVVPMSCVFAGAVYLNIKKNYPNIREHGPTADDYAYGLFFGVVWPICLVMFLTWFLLKGVVQKGTKWVLEFHEGRQKGRRERLGK